MLFFRLLSFALRNSESTDFPHANTYTSACTYITNHGDHGEPGGSPNPLNMVVLSV